MNDVPYRALVIDDDPSIRKLSALALGDEGFFCVTVGNGVQAMEQLKRTQFDLVVTDLAMPLMHGHSVAVELLGAPLRPVIAVLTGVTEPRLAKDLMARGVDDVIAKPVNFAMFAAKLKSLVSRRKEMRESCPATQPVALAEQLVPMEVDDLVQRLLTMPRILPLTCEGLDVFELIKKCDEDTPRIAAALECDASLLAEVLRIANSAACNPDGIKIADVEEAVEMIGQKRVSELALATHALGAITTSVVPWMNIGVVSRRSIAAGVAVELLAEQSHREDETAGLLPAAIMHSLGRVALASLYPAQYAAMIEHCQTAGCALSVAEHEVLPEPHTEVLARLLQFWNVPPDIYEPLVAVGQSYAHLATLPEPARTRAELLKVALMVGELAVGKWDAWDLLDAPPRAVLERLAIDNLGRCIDGVRADLEAIVRFHLNISPAQPAAAQTDEAFVERGCVICRHVSPATGSMIYPILASQGLCMVEGPSHLPLVVNGVGASPDVLRESLALIKRKPSLVVVDEATRSAVEGDCTTLSLPCSYGQFQKTCAEALQMDGPETKRGVRGQTCA